MGIVETAGDLFEKGVELAGTVAKQAGDFASTAGLRAQILDKDMEYGRLMKELGTAVYDIVKDDPEIVEANKGLFDRIAGVVAARQALADKLSEAEAAADASRPIDVDPVPPEGADAAQTVKDAASQVAERIMAAAGGVAQQVKTVVDEAAERAAAGKEAAPATEPADQQEAPAQPAAEVVVESVGIAEEPAAEAEAPAAEEPAAQPQRVYGYRSATNAGAQEVTE